MSRSGCRFDGKRPDLTGDDVTQTGDQQMVHGLVQKHTRADT